MLQPEWQRRVEVWRNEIKKHFYRELGTVEMSGFLTKEQLSVDEAAHRAFQPMPPHTKWGAKWEYGWFRGRVTLPAEALGQRIVLRPATGAESLVYINRKIAGGCDWAHPNITLTRNAQTGEDFEILIEAYGGHGPAECHGGPTPPGRETVPEPEPTQTETGETTFGIWEEDAYQLWLDAETLFQLRNNLDPDSLRVAEIDKGLKDFTLIVDFELPHAEMMETIRAARKRLEPVLACVNGSTAPVMYAFGHSHIDVAWLWPLQETERKCGRTFGTQLALMEEYPEYKFLQSQPHLFRMTQRLYPELYQRIKDAIKQGQFVPDGGMWVEADTNITGGESLIRQFMHGKRFFREEFGVESEMLWLPDVFGYSGALPQIMKGCGIKYFSTAKIFWNYNGGDHFPYNTFTWEGIDGSTVLAHFCNDYNSHTEPNAVIQRWKERSQKEGISSRMFPFGWGDGGGGATRDHLEYLRRQVNLEGAPKVRIAAPANFFRDLEREGVPEARYVGELYFQAHRGTYTSQAWTKRNNRKCELGLREVELWGAVARIVNGFVYPAAEVDEAWKTVLLNHFHDIIPGSSIHRVYEEAEAAHQKVLNFAQKLTQNVTSSFCEPQKSALTIFNSLSWPRTEVVELPEGFAAVQNHDGGVLPTQVVDGKTLARVTVPACGWTTIQTGAVGAVENRLVATTNRLENDLLRLELNEQGEITSLFDKESGRELAAGPGNSFKMYKDVPTLFDAWDIDSMYHMTPVELNESAEIGVVAAGPLVAKLVIKRKLSQSLLTQEIIMYSGSRRIEFRTVVDWQESHKLLKVAFPVSIHTNEAVHEIQFGHIRRPNHKSRQFDADRFEVAQQKWTAIMEENRGFAVLNDCKYGISVNGNSVNLTLLKSALAPDMTADKGRQEFTYAIYAWNGSFADSDVVREAYALNCPPVITPGAAGEQALFSIDAPDVIIETVKPAEDGSRDIIVRLYETKRSAAFCTLKSTLPITEVTECTMLEAPVRVLAWQTGQVILEFRPFEIKTLRLKF